LSELAALRARFTDVVEGEAALRAATGEAHQRALDKVVDAIDDHARRFIAASPFVFIGTTAPDGTLDVSPKGDPAGFVRVLDERTLAIPDRPGTGATTPIAISSPILRSASSSSCRRSSGRSG
jgi:predicted pyridoxine 5'-phosphate oxidase superfamily flavin-nucleotide-binding protein